MTTQQKNNILVIGAGGFVGTALTRTLVTKGYRVSTLSLVPLSPTVSVYHAWLGDVRDSALLRKALKGIHTVYYLAAFKKNIAIHTKSSFTVLSLNASPFLSFLEVIKDSDVQRVVYTSSTIVEYAHTLSQPLDGYVLGKYINELSILTYRQEHHRDIVIVRMAPVYGPGDNFNPETANFIPSLIRRVHTAETHIDVWGKGKRKLQFLYIDDAVANLIAAGKGKGTFYVCGNPESESVDSVVKKIVHHMGKKLSLCHDIHKPDKATQLSTFTNLISPKVSMDEGIKKTIAYYRTLHE